MDVPFPLGKRLMVLCDDERKLVTGGVSINCPV